MSRVLEELQRDLELEGYTPGTEAYEVAMRERRVAKCVEMQGVSTCSSCRALMSCELAMAHRRDLAFGRKKKKAEVVMGNVRKGDKDRS